MSSLSQWRAALERNPSNGRTQYYHGEMMSLLEAGEAAQAQLDKANEEVVSLREAVRELRTAGKEFLDASNAASRQMRDPVELRTVMQRWQNAGARLRELTKSAAIAVVGRN